MYEITPHGRLDCELYAEVTSTCSHTQSHRDTSNLAAQRLRRCEDDIWMHAKPRRERLLRQSKRWPAVGSAGAP
jgi:hypothetical protein